MSNPLLTFLDPLRELTLASIVFRFTLSVICGAMIGFERGKKRHAAGLWASACMGLAIGIGFYEAAVIMCLFLFGVIVFLNNLDQRYLKSSTVLRIYVEHTAELPFSAILQTIRAEGWHVTHTEYLGQEGQDGVGSILDLQRTGRESDGEILLEALRKVCGMLFVEDV